jgi:hypothetical protein
MNILSLVSQNLDNFYQIQTKCYRNSDTVFFFPIHRTKRGLSEKKRRAKKNDNIFKLRASPGYHLKLDVGSILNINVP